MDNTSQVNNRLGIITDNLIVVTSVAGSLAIYSAVDKAPEAAFYLNTLLWTFILIPLLTVVLFLLRYRHAIMIGYLHPPTRRWLSHGAVGVGVGYTLVFAALSACPALVNLT